MDYNFVSSGGVRIAGHATTRKSVFMTFPFGPGSTVFLAYRARRGVLERVTIKRINVLSNPGTGHKKIPLYVDTLNALYNQWDLCTEADAIVYARMFYEHQLAEWSKVSAC